MYYEYVSLLLHACACTAGTASFCTTVFICHVTHCCRQALCMVHSCCKLCFVVIFHRTHTHVLRAVLVSTQSHKHTITCIRTLLHAHALLALQLHTYTFGQMYATHTCIRLCSDIHMTHQHICVCYMYMYERRRVAVAAAATYHVTSIHICMCSKLCSLEHNHVYVHVYAPDHRI